MALGGYGNVLAGMLSPHPMPPVSPGGMPHPGVYPFPPGPSAAPPNPQPGPIANPPAGSSPPFRMGPGDPGFPPWLQEKIAAFNTLHDAAVAARGGTPGTTMAGPNQGLMFSGLEGRPGFHSPLYMTGSPGPYPYHQPPGSTGPPVTPPGGGPPNWQTYWEQWYKQRQPYADWLSGYVR